MAESEYTKVFWVVDFDVIQKETTEARKGTKTQIQQFAEFRKELKDYDNVEVLVNNPCLEFWLLLHFEQTARYFTRCIDAERRLKKYLADYKKTEQYYKKSDKDTYKKLKPKLKQAIDNANKPQIQLTVNSEKWVTVRFGLNFYTLTPKSKLLHMNAGIVLFWVKSLID